MGGGRYHPARGVLDLEPVLEVVLRRAARVRFRGGLVFKAHTLEYHSTLGLRVIKKKSQPCRAPARDSQSNRATPRARQGQLE